MSDGLILVESLRRAAALYLQIAYPDGAVPENVRARVAALASLPPDSDVPENCLEPVSGASAARRPESRSFALRLGQPTYPHMKLVIEACPGGGYLLRADAHDAHLNAPSGSPDSAALAVIRARNKQLTEQIEAAWMAAGLPTFRGFLRREVERRKRQSPPPGR